MWTYHQKTGELVRNGEVEAFGYSGAGDGKNNPDAQHIHNVGPIPRGTWTVTSLTIGNTPHGPYVLHLQPEPGTETFGRAGFLMHGDNVAHPGTASQGCIIMPRHVRETVWESGDRALLVES